MNSSEIIVAAVIAGVWVISAVTVVLMAIFAPEGYEDETGFHYGKKED